MNWKQNFIIWVFLPKAKESYKEKMKQKIISQTKSLVETVFQQKTMSKMKRVH